MATSFVPLRLRSRGSRLAGTIPPEDLPGHLKRLGFDAGALVDKGNLYGAIPFYEACLREGVKPIIGAEVTCPVLGKKATLIALSREGFANLSRVVTETGLKDDLLLTEAVAAGGEGLAALSSDVEYAASLVSLLSQERVWVEIVPNRQNTSAMRDSLAAARKRHLKALASWEVLYLEPCERPVARLLKAMGEGSLFSQVEVGACQASLEESVGLRHMGELHPEVLSETLNLARMVDLKLDLGKPHFPRATPSRGESFETLGRLCARALPAKYPKGPERAQRRLASELGVIEKLGLADYFLVVNEITSFARRERIASTGRGSGAGSIVAYLLNITQVDPIRHGLVFERFLNEHRPDYPDLDIDISWRRRDEVIAYAYKRYGTDKVAMISTHNSFELRSAAREVAKAMGLSPYEAQTLSSRLPYHKPKEGDPGVTRVLAAIRPELPTRERSEISRLTEAIIGLPHHTSVHCGGIVISDRPITYYTPLEMAAKGIQVTQFDMHAIEKVGLVKIDLLGNRALSVIEETLRDVEARYGITVHIPPRDAKTARILAAGETMSCFQLESPAMRNLLKMLKARDEDDATLALALVRPGPSAGGMKEKFIERRMSSGRYGKGAQRAASLALPLYEEDVMRIISRFTGMSLAEADILRRELKGGTVDAADLERKFMFLAESAGVNTRRAREAWQHVRRFAAYTFCKAHAASYGVLAWTSAYFKANFPLEYYAATLRNHAGMYPTWAHVNEARRWGIDVLLPSVNHSEEDFALEGGAVRTGLCSVKHLSESTMRLILKERREAPFRSLSDFLGRIPANKDEMASLISCGALDGVVDDRCGTLAGYMALKGDHRTAEHQPSLGLLGGEINLPTHCFTELQKRRMEYDVLGFSPLMHPIEFFDGNGNGNGNGEGGRKRGRIGGACLRGVLAALRHFKAERVDLFFVTLDGADGLHECTLPRKALNHRLELGRAYAATGHLTHRFGTQSLRIATLAELSEKGV
jgi:DNA polymerase-3 subunit alpha